MTSQLVAYFVFDKHRKRGRWSDNVVPDQGPERGIKLNVVNMNPNGSLGKIERFFHQKMSDHWCLLYLKTRLLIKTNLQLACYLAIPSAIQVSEYAMNKPYVSKI